MDAAQIFDMVKTFVPGFDKQPLEQQSASISSLTHIITDWFRTKKQNTLLKADESELVLMFREVDGVLLMIPTIINDDDVMVRGLLEHSVNVTEMSKRIPAIDLLPTLINASKDKTPGGSIKLTQHLITALRVAANHPDCRLEVAEEEGETPAPYNQEAAASVVKDGVSAPEPPEVDALGYVEEDDDLTPFEHFDEEDEEEDDDEERLSITNGASAAAADENSDTHS